MMRPEPNKLAERWRAAASKAFPEVPYGSNTGAFIYRGLRIISSGANPPPSCLENVPPEVLAWEHVSVSRFDGKLPTWEDMCLVKRLFWGDDETVIQFHPKRSEYVNVNPGVLHLWKKKDGEHELPPTSAV